VHGDALPKTYRYADPAFSPVINEVFSRRFCAMPAYSSDSQPARGSAQAVGDYL